MTTLTINITLLCFYTTVIDPRFEPGSKRKHRGGTCVAAPITPRGERGGMEGKGGDGRGVLASGKRSMCMASASSLGCSRLGPAAAAAAATRSGGTPALRAMERMRA